MHPTKPPEHPVSLISDIGDVWRYLSLRALVEALGLAWLSSYVGPHFRHSLRGAGGEVNIRSYPFILRSDFGEVITAEDCKVLRDGERRTRLIRGSWRSRYAERTWNGVGPVPFVHRLRRGHYHRRISTTAEHRSSANVVFAEGEPIFRAARNRHNLPSAWDDVQVAARSDRSWKKFRITRWKYCAD